jgi:hypothetical protein
MDQIYFWILILFFIILVLDYSDKYFKKKEHFNNINLDYTKEQYFEETKL